MVYEAFGQLPTSRPWRTVPGLHGALVRVQATGLCRSDWHGWMGHDPDIRRFPHVPGHELTGVVEAVGDQVTRWVPGVPFVCARGTCGNAYRASPRLRPPDTNRLHPLGLIAEFTAIDWPT